MSVTTAAGFVAAGTTAGLKPSGAADLALLRNLGPRFDAAAVFTTNRVQAAPVQWSRQVLTDGRLQAVILNSGGANACTGPDGFADTHRTAELVADELGIGAIDVAVCSTGLIGVRLPMDRIAAAVPGLVQGLAPDGGGSAAEAIMTTDTRPKQASRSGGRSGIAPKSAPKSAPESAPESAPDASPGWSVGGMAKGAAMLAPGLATMLVVITTDAVLDGIDPGAELAAACRTTFERVDSDGCMSTNDTVLLLSSGASGISPEPGEFAARLTEVCADLARQLVDDAEGAAHQIEIVVSGAATEAEALTVGRSIARNNLFKCAVFGRDPNWGRVLAAIGTTDATFEPDRLDVAFNGVQVCRAGSIGEPRELVDLSGAEVRLDVELHAGSAAATVWTTDLTYDYVKENAEYST